MRDAGGLRNVGQFVTKFGSSDHCTYSYRGIVPKATCCANSDFVQIRKLRQPALVVLGYLNTDISA
jgi:hypothetical protein